MENHLAPRQGVYLLHFEEKLHHAQHYIGFSKNVQERTRVQLKGTSPASKLPQAIRRAGIKMCVARVWYNVPQSFERRLHNRKNSRRLCPICNPFSAKQYPDHRVHKMPKGYKDPF